jgi:ParB family chromosome partitioning protein
VLQIPLEQVLPNPRQPRTHFDQSELHDLAESIRQHGVIQPLIVSLGELPDTYILIAGERRLLAARQAGLDHVPALLREASDQQRLEMALVENVQRADLGPLEAAEAYRQLADEFGLSHEQIAERVGKSRVSVTNTLRLLKLPADVRQALAERALSEGHARALLALPTAAAQSAALQTILRQGLNVRQTEDLVRRLSGQKPERPPQPPLQPEIVALEDRLRSGLGTKVKVNRHGTQGTLVIHYFDDEQLNALVTRILGEMEF